MISRYSDLLPLMQPDLPHCPDILIMQHLQLCGRDFCRATEAWIEKNIVMDIVASQADYVLAPMYDAEILRPHKAWANADRKGAWLDESAYSFSPSTNTFTFYQAPSTAVTGGLIVDVVLMPRLFTIELAGWFMERFAEGIAAGAKAALMVMKDKGWSSPDRVQFFQMEYARFKNMAMRERFVHYKTNQAMIETPRWTP